MQTNQQFTEVLDEVEFSFNVPEGKKTVSLGLVIHYSTTNKEWQAWYGKNRQYLKVTDKTIDGALKKLSQNLDTL